MGNPGLIILFGLCLDIWGTQQASRRSFLATKVQESWCFQAGPGGDYCPWCLLQIQGVAGGGRQGLRFPWFGGAVDAGRPLARVLALRLAVLSQSPSGRCVGHHEQVRSPRTALCHAAGPLRRAHGPQNLGKRCPRPGEQMPKKE